MPAHPICEKSCAKLPGRICFPGTEVTLYFHILCSQTFDREKYSHLRSDAPNNNNNNSTNGKEKTLVGLRIDDKGGIYLQVNSKVPKEKLSSCL